MKPKLKSGIELTTHRALVLFKAQLGEPFLEILIFVSLFFVFFRQNRHLSSQNRHLKNKYNIKVIKSGM